MTTDQVPGSPDLVDVNFASRTAERDHRRRYRLFGGAEAGAQRKLKRQQLLWRRRLRGAERRLGAYNKSTASARPTHIAASMAVAHDLPELPRFDAVRVGVLSVQFQEHRARPDLRLSDHRVPGISAGVSLQRNDLLTFAASSAQQAVDWVQKNGHPYTSESVSTFIEPDGTTITSSTALVARASRPWS